MPRKRRSRTTLWEAFDGRNGGNIDRVREFFNLDRRSSLREISKELNWDYCFVQKIVREELLMPMMPNPHRWKMDTSPWQRAGPHRLHLHVLPCQNWHPCEPRRPGAPSSPRASRNFPTSLSSPWENLRGSFPTHPRWIYSPFTVRGTLAESSSLSVAAIPGSLN